MMRWFAAIILLAMFLGGCAQGDLLRETIKVRGAKIADQGLADAMWVTCYAASVGAVVRKFGRTVEDAETYRAFCDGAPAVLLRPKFLGDARPRSMIKGPKTSRSPCGAFRRRPRRPTG